MLFRIFRGNYAWDIAALNENFMTYTGLGEKNDQFAVWDRNVVLPMAGKIVTKVEGEIDNSPDLRAAIDLADHKEGRHVTLTEKPQNIIELKPMKGKDSPFLLRMIHLRQNSIPSSIQVVFNTHVTNNFLSCFFQQFVDYYYIVIRVVIFQVLVTSCFMDKLQTQNGKGISCWM